ncbi:MAG: MOSC domain-containing protein [Eubacteriales bacterium]|nr:MOSC domain-containing protein [Eubacteriales bacterium]MDD3200106.1 MOSC domain-containing protein [Eubacteriales bacterium]MDD4121381.1 MOSC domain-containing protein [Eubacteriales bacterium]MDD4630383.1 MOSC domain-containing protein [Eubacteriales bacterium]
MAKVISINISEKTGEVKFPVDMARFTAGGIEGDAHFGLDDIRQVSLLANESVDKMRAMGLKLGAGAFAENITTYGIELKTLPIGTKLKIGETIQEVSKIGKECHRGCAIMQQKGSCIMPTEGIFTRVLNDGTVKVGDNIEILQV